MPAPYQYQFNPSPQPGYGIWGGVPGAVPLPSPSSDLAAQFPGLSRANTAASGDILSELGGTLTPGTINLLQDTAARYGIGAGMPGAPTPGTFTGNMNLESLGLSSLQEQQQGLKDYASIIPTISRTQTVDPALQATIAAGNAVNAAAPNPQQQASYAQQLFDQYLKRFNRPVGASGVGGGGMPPDFGVPSGPVGAGAVPFGGGFNPPEGFTGHEVNVSDYGAPAGTFSSGGSSYFDPYAGGSPFAGFGAGGGNAPMSDAELEQLLAGVTAGTSDLGF